MSHPNSQSTVPYRPRGFQFSLRMALIAMTVLAVGCAIAAPWIRSLPAYRQQELAWALALFVGGYVCGMLLSLASTKAQMGRGADAVILFFTSNVAPWYRRPSAWAAATIILLQCSMLIMTWLMAVRQEHWLRKSFWIYFMSSFFISQAFFSLRLFSRTQWLKIEKQGVFCTYPLLAGSWIEFKAPLVTENRLVFRKKYTPIDIVIDCQLDQVRGETIQRIRTLLDANNISYHSDET